MINAQGGAMSCNLAFSPEKMACYCNVLNARCSDSKVNI
jgi:hypothetical protein